MFKMNKLEFILNQFELIPMVSRLTEDSIVQSDHA